MSGYRAVWRIRGAPTLLVIGVAARLGIGMTPIVLLLLVAETTGRYALGGLTVAAYALAGTVVNPLVARLHGPRVLLVSALVHAACLLVLACVTALPVLVVVAAAAGASYPPLTGTVRRAWTTLTDRTHPARHAALAAETSLFELVHVIGPLLVAASVAVTGGFQAALIFAAAVTVLGGAVLRSEGRPVAGSRGALRAPGFGELLVCVGMLGTAFGMVTVAVPASVAGPGSAGLLLGLWSAGSAVSGLWFGTRRPARILVPRYAALLALIGCGFVLLAGMPGPVALAVALVVGGAAIAPALTVENDLVCRLVPRPALNEAYTWAVSVAVSASAAGGALAGVIVDGPLGARWAFALAGGLVLIATTVAVLPGGSLLRADRRAAAPKLMIAPAWAHRPVAANETEDRVA